MTSSGALQITIRKRVVKMFLIKDRRDGEGKGREERRRGLEGEEVW